MASRINPNGAERTESNIVQGCHLIHFYKSEKEDKIDYQMRMYVGDDAVLPIIAKDNIFEKIKAEE